MSVDTTQPQRFPVPRYTRSKSSKVILLGLAALAGSLVAVLLWPREPSYRGRGLSSWMRDLEARQVETQARAAEAITHIGPSAVPFILLSGPLKHLSSEHRLVLGRIDLD